jgi:hypothetical protein
MLVWLQNQKPRPCILREEFSIVQLAQFDKAEADFEKADAIDPRESAGSAAAGFAMQEKKPSATVTNLWTKTQHHRR